MDALDDPPRLERLRDHLQEKGIPLFPISGVTGEGVPALLEAMWREVAEARARERDTAPVTADDHA